LGHQTSIHLERWPDFDVNQIVSKTVTIMVQINGKVRAKFEANTNISEDEAKNKALLLPEVKKWLGPVPPKKMIYVPNKIISFVV
jgi:leucyl-tRNA synthetase